MRQRLDLGGADGEVGVEQVRQTNAVCLRRQTQQSAVRVECEGPAGLDKLEVALFPTKNEALSTAAIGAIDEIERVGAETRRLHDFGDAVRIEALHPCAGLQFVEIQAAHAIPRLSERQLTPAGADPPTIPLRQSGT